MLTVPHKNFISGIAKAKRNVVSYLIIIMGLSSRFLRFCLFWHSIINVRGKYVLSKCPEQILNHLLQMFVVRAFIWYISRPIIDYDTQSNGCTSVICTPSQTQSVTFMCSLYVSCVTSSSTKSLIN